MINARMSESDPRLYNPSRDVAHNFGEVMQEVAKRCEESTWEPVLALARAGDVSQDDLAKGLEALLYFVLSQDEHKESMAQGLARCGFLDLKPEVRVILMAHLGTITLGYHWAGVRETTLGGIGPALNYKTLRWHGRHAALLMRMPWWKRRLYNIWRKFKKISRTLRGYDA